MAEHSARTTPLSCRFEGRFGLLVHASDTARTSISAASCATAKLRIGRTYIDDVDHDTCV
jgi:hypothetical protein